ncbi:MAG: hypothetical protein AAF481_13605 [Acidobacteriota bacterium]
MFDVADMKFHCLECEGDQVFASKLEMREEWHHYRFDCADSECGNNTWVEVPEFLDARPGSQPPGNIHLRNLSVRCGRCDQHPVLAAYEPGEGFNQYVYECENGSCSARRRVRLTKEQDEFARRDPAWRGGAKHAGAGDH